MLEYSEENALRQKTIGSKPHSEFNRRLDTNRDGSGTTEMAGAAATYGIKPDAGEVYVIDEIRIAITDGATLDADGFGGVAALATGCLLQVREKPGDSDEAVVQDLTLGVPIKSHTELAAMGHTEFTDVTGGCIVQCSVGLGAPIRIDGDRGESLVFQTQDNLAALSGVGVTAIGRTYSNSAV